MSIQQIDTELERLRRLLARSQTPDPVDVAVVEALSSSDVQDLLRPILEAGAILDGVTMESAGTMAGVAQLTFETKWLPGQSRISFPSRVRALVGISPPRVLKVVELLPGVNPTTSAFGMPTGAVPVALQNVGTPSEQQAFALSAETNRLFADWLVREGLARRISAEGSGGLRSRTYCSTLMCTETTLDD